MSIKAPFSYFGGKSRVADVVWSRFGNTPNYVEPFAGSLAVLLTRPHAPTLETINDADCYLSNFWRALRNDPDAVAYYADWPVSEIDLHARHKWLLGQDEFKQRMLNDPEYHDVKIAGWWVWGKCAWIGQGWCHKEATQVPHLGDAGIGINRRIPSGAGDRKAFLTSYLNQLSARLRNTRVCYGDWSRVLGASVTFKNGLCKETLTGIFLDPPYGDGAMEYAAGGNKTDIAQRVAEWAIENGDNKLLRIALCGYEGCFDMPASWECYEWKTSGGYGSQGDGAGRENAHRERIWFSPHCLKPDRQRTIFDEIEVPA